MKEWKKTFFQGFRKSEQNFIRDERMKKTGYFAMLIRNHFTNVVSGQKNNFGGKFSYEKHFSQT